MTAWRARWVGELIRKSHMSMYNVVECCIVLYVVLEVNLHEWQTFSQKEMRRDY